MILICFFFFICVVGPGKPLKCIPYQVIVILQMQGGAKVWDVCLVPLDPRRLETSE